MIKYFRLSWHEILWERSFVNLQLLLAAIPPMDFDEEGAEKQHREDKNKKEQAEISQFLKFM